MQNNEPNLTRAKPAHALSVGRELLTDHVIRSATGTPENLRLYAADVHGPAAFACAALDLIGGKPIEFAACTREPAGTAAPPVVNRIERFQVPEGLRVVRWCGEGGDPLGVGSSTLQGTGSIDNKGTFQPDDAPLLAAALCWAMLSGGGSWVFRTL